MDPAEILNWLKLAGGGGGAFVLVFYSIKWAINGMRQDVRDIKATVTALDSKLDHHGERISRLEGRQEGLDKAKLLA